MVFKRLQIPFFHVMAFGRPIADVGGVASAGMCCEFEVKILLHMDSFFDTFGLPSVVSLMMSDLSGGEPFDSSPRSLSPQPLTSRCLCPGDQ